MLSELKVQNFAIIDNLTVEFHDGLTALTGETGAGKSLIIDAIGLLLGMRGSSSMIRNGSQKAIVEGVFEDVSENTKKVLEDLQIEILDNDVIVIKREISTSGKNLIRVNGEIITLNQLERLAETLGDIHTQNDTHKLFNQQNYLTFINSEEIKELLAEYQKCRNAYMSSLKKYEELVKLSETDTLNMEFIVFQYQELEKANLSINEEHNLEDELSFLNNYEMIFKYLSQINDDFNENNIIDNLYDSISNIDKLSKVLPEFKEDVETLNDSYYFLEDFYKRIKLKLKTLDYDTNRLNEINERLSFLNDLKHKYHKSIAELIKLKSELKNQIDNYEQIDDEINKAKTTLEDAFRALSKAAFSLTKARKKSAESLKANVLLTLKDLMLPKVDLEIAFNDYSITDMMNSSIFKQNGCDEIDMLISFNVGENKKSLSKVASGGEMSRIMLALKVHTLKTLKLSTVIFDEIDSGISGSAAGKVGEKLKEIANDIQVLTITHLPIVASFAKNQYNITKSFENNQTFTKIEELSFARRVEVLSNMMSFGPDSEKAKELATQLLANNQKSGR